jgi:hypothetical protein
MNRKPDIDVDAELARMRDEHRQREDLNTNGHSSDQKIIVPNSGVGPFDDLWPTDDSSEKSSWLPLDEKLLGDDRAPAPALDFDALPPAWCEWIRQMADDCGSPADYVASNLVGTASAILGNARRVRAGDGWVEQPHLWVANVGAPSSNKTPALRPFQTACSQIELKDRPAFEAAMAKYKEEKDLAGAAEAAWKAEIKEAFSKGETRPAKPEAAEPPKAPTEPPVLVIDTTTERVQMLLVDNHRGLVLVRSELAGFLGQLEKHGSSDADRGYYLESWDGHVYMVDRIKYEDGARIVPYNSLAMVASVQPDKLETVFAGPNDGLFTRFLYTFPEPTASHPLTGQGNRDRIKCLLNAFDCLHSLTWARDHEGRPTPELLDVDDDGAGSAAAAPGDLRGNQRGRTRHLGYVARKEPRASAPARLGVRVSPVGLSRRWRAASHRERRIRSARGAVPPILRIDAGAHSRRPGLQRGAARRRRARPVHSRHKARAHKRTAGLPAARLPLSPQGRTAESRVCRTCGRRLGPKA